MKRKYVKERVPFRLTRVLVKAMDASGIDGIYRKTCEIVMDLIRNSKVGLLAVLQSFIYDPLINWDQFMDEENDI